MIELDISATVVALVALLGGVVVPALTSLLKRADWPSGAKKVLAGVVATLTAVAVVFANGDVSLDNILTNAAVLWTTGQVAYRNLWAQTGVETVLATRKVL